MAEMRIGFQMGGSRLYGKMLLIIGNRQRREKNRIDVGMMPTKSDADVGMMGALDLDKGPTPIGGIGGGSAGREQRVNLEAGGCCFRLPFVNRRLISMS
jgi:hypothetical protein